MKTLVMFILTALGTLYQWLHCQMAEIWDACGDLGDAGEETKSRDFR